MAQVKVDFSGTTVFVAGGTSGINLGIAEGFAAAGARVAVMSRSKEKVDAAVARLQSHVCAAKAGVDMLCRRDPVTIPAESSRTATSTTVPEDHPEVATCSC